MAHLPKIVYEHLPNIYTVVGTGLALNFQHPIGVISSLLMVATGLYTFNVRLSHSKAINEKLMRKQYKSL
jgi:hypothetical protein